MERQLSSSQRDNIFLEQAKEDRQFRKDMSEALTQRVVYGLHEQFQGGHETVHALNFSMYNSTRQEIVEHADNVTYTYL